MPGLGARGSHGDGYDYTWLESAATMTIRNNLPKDGHRADLSKDDCRMSVP